MPIEGCVEGIAQNKSHQQNKVDQTEQSYEAVGSGKNKANKSSKQ